MSGALQEPEGAACAAGRMLPRGRRAQTTVTLLACAGLALGCGGAPLAPGTEIPYDGAAALAVSGRAQGAVELTPDSLVLDAGGDGTLRVAVRDARGRPARKPAATWASDAPGIVTVSGDGTVRAVTVGETWVAAQTAYGTDRARVRVRPHAPPPVGCDDYARARTVPVSTAAALHDALRTARPGDLIVLADGIYSGTFAVTVSGTAEQPIVLCGSRSAVLDGGSVSGATTVVSLRASRWVLHGFTLRNAVRGVLTEQADDNVLRELQVHDVGQEAIHIRVFSSRNVVERSVIHRTGRVVAEWGEGVYLGSWNGHWCTFTGCAPDRSDGNQVLDNIFGPDVTAEHIDAKEGTTGGIVRGNVFDGTGMVLARDWIDSWVLVQGNGYTVVGNRGSRSLRHGFETEVMLSGWGSDNLFADNLADVGASGYGFLLRSGANGNVVRCSNVVRNAGSGLTNVACQ